MEKLGGKIFLTNDIKEYKDEELASIMTAIHNEIERRQNVKRLNAWDRMFDAIRDYVAEYGCIEVTDSYDTITIDESIVGDWRREEIRVECDGE